MPDLTPAQMAILQRLVECGFTPMALPLYPNATGIRRNSIAALLVSDESGRLKILGQPSLLIDGNLTVRIERNRLPVFVWKSREVVATPELLAEIAGFSSELSRLLSSLP
jgi:hypothetical protein